jgi:predicted chitinase
MLTNKFYDEVEDSLFFGSLPDFQRDPLTSMEAEFTRRGMESVEQLAYIMATAYHETDRFKAYSEYGDGGRNLYATTVPLFRKERAKYYGRGWVMLTWLGNYARMSLKATVAFGKEIDLVNNPELILESKELNAFVTFQGMIDGTFTGRGIDSYINRDETDYVNARKVINGLDKAELIAGYARQFYGALTDGRSTEDKDQRHFRFF